MKKDMLITVTFKIPGAVVEEAKSRQKDGLSERGAVEAEIRRVVRDYLVRDVTGSDEEAA